MRNASFKPPTTCASRQITDGILLLTETATFLAVSAKVDLSPEFFAAVPAAVEIMVTARKASEAGSAKLVWSSSVKTIQAPSLLAADRVIAWNAGTSLLSTMNSIASEPAKAIYVLAPLGKVRPNPANQRRTF